MLYRPTFCCECGNKVERTKWRLWTSRRFCENCESEFVKQEWLPKISLVVFALVGGLFGFGSYLKSPEKPLSLVSAPSANKIAPPGNTNQQTANENSAKIISRQNLSNINQNSSLPEKSAPTPVLVKAEDLQIAAEEPVYFCGAQTKKGNPCSRKVKGGGRCWQHTGQPSMLPKAKLAASR
jgi:hypothetical protein